MGLVNVIVIKNYSGRTIQVHYFLEETILSLVKTAISLGRTLAQFIMSNGTINGAGERFRRKRNAIISLTTPTLPWKD
jgi:hypothetical protein